MFEISQLKEKKLPELQDIAKELNMSKYRSLKKLDLVYKILDHQAANPAAKKETPPAPTQKNEGNKRPQRQRRERVQKPKENNQKAIDFSKDKETPQAKPNPKEAKKEVSKEAPVEAKKEAPSKNQRQPNPRKESDNRDNKPQNNNRNKNNKRDHQKKERW